MDDPVYKPVGSVLNIETLKITNDILSLTSNLDQFKGVWQAIGRDEQEVGGYATVMGTVFSHWENIPFTVNYIKQLRGEPLKYSDKDVRHRG